ncbi:MFS transporter [Candidatus Woesearchaeota archaeon]|nr:MFS transporter [Candidatus Woesearchaeota archaeon]
MNRTIKLLMISDVFVVTGFGLIDPILAIFIKENLIGGTVFTASLASTIFLLVKSMVQLPFSKYIDKESDKTKWVILGSIFISIVPFIYIYSSHIKMIYLAQILYGIGAGLSFPTWLGLWSTNLDKKNESFEWSLYSTLVSLGVAVAAAIGGAIAQFIGFTYTFMFVGLMSFIGSFILLGLEKGNKKRNGITTLHYHRKRKMAH